MSALVNNINMFTARDVPGKDTLNNGVIKVFAPFRIVQIILGSCRVNIRDQVVTAPTVVQKLYTITLLIASTFLGRSLIVTYSKNYFTEPQLTYIYLIGLSSLHFTFCLSVLHCRFINRGNVELYQKMQNIDRIMEINWSNDVNLSMSHYKHNRTTVFSLLSVFSALICITIYLTHGIIGVHEILGNNWTLVTFIFEMGCCSSHIKFFIDRMHRVNSIIINHLKSEQIGGRTLLVQSINISNTRRHDFESSATDMYLNEILSTFISFQNQYRFQVPTYFVINKTTCLSRFKFKVTVLIPLNNFQRALILDFLITATMTVLHVCMLLLLSIGSEMFLREVNNTKKLSNSILSRYLDGPLRQKAKKMLNLIESDPPRFCVYNMWSMDARLLLNMFAIITNAFVIILQFSFT
ncbi:uncharacterized protein LOC133517434 [Cydia pomonella]|uniref:uncharacterized protein LOC133517434 n=1 Tax=Cydia pomonella TaxID=82600 RepID=UPI002ADD6773|nr:uncharacterized protein LOC133517434 [Cydia pomonella]